MQKKKLILPAIEVWSTTLDGKYTVRVTRIEGGTARVGLFQIKLGKKLLKEELVPLAYDALFGPDVADVDAWCEKAVVFVDRFVGKRRKK